MPAQEPLPSRSVDLEARSTPSLTVLESSTEIQATHTAELVIALVGPIGSPLHEVAGTISEVLTREFGYDSCRIIRLSEFITQYSKEQLPTNTFERKEFLIAKGDELRGRFGSGILAELAVKEIATDREEVKEAAGDIAYRPRRICHIIDSIKNQSELEVLRLVYRDMLYTVGVFSPLADRHKNLRQGMNDGEIFRLIDKDSGEEIKHGQTVRDTFPQADFFLRIESNVTTQITEKVKRYLTLILGTSVVTPSVSETAMYLAASAAGNSACLSRQVGAAVTDSKGEVISVGWNDVPKSGGNLYTYDPINDANSAKDFRCWNFGQKCYNDEEKRLLSEHIVDSLVDAEIVAGANRGEVLEIISKDKKLKSLIEFSRSIHAEMHAIIIGSQLGGDKLRGGKLFVTTYPCHSCARHIIASGIMEVYYIEPYIKSLATKLHDDAITEVESDASKVRILSYDGVAPSRYLKLFKMTVDSRKTNGRLVKPDLKTALPKFDKSMEAMTALEGIVLKSLETKGVPLGEENAENRP